MTDVQREIILAYADHNRSIKTTGAALYRATSTIQYHLNKVRSETGLEPRDPGDLAILVDGINNGKWRSIKLYQVDAEGQSYLIPANTRNQARFKAWKLYKPCKSFRDFIGTPVSKVKGVHYDS